MEWTKQQQDAINARGSSIIVSAAAGSGKTAVLTERLVRLIADPDSGISADKIVVVTFTNDAASELKKRLDRKLRELINDDPGNRYLLKQQVLLQNAKISTINSFCFELLRDNITDQGITSGFAILDETDDAVIKSQAMEELLDYYSGTESEFLTISELFDRFCMSDQSTLIDVIKKTDNFLSSVAMSDKWLDMAVSEYKKPFADTIYFKKLFESTTKKLLNASRLADDNVEILRDIFPDMNIKQAKDSVTQSNEDCERVDSLLNIVQNMRFPTEDEANYASGFTKLVTVNKNVLHNIAKRNVYKARRDKVKEIVKSAAMTMASAEKDFDETGRVVELLAEVVKKYREIVWEKKCSRNSISFDDGERLALELLADIDENGNIVQSETAKRISEYFDMIMIDEYQDSNNKQDLIFKLLSKNYRLGDDGRPIYGDNAFLVGDVKQSIYRFRLANPKNFIEVMSNSELYDENSDASNQYIPLNQNFRSSTEVIDFVNFIFTQIMSESCGDIDYDENERLNFGAKHYLAPHEDSRKTVISFINTDPVSEGDDDDGEAVEAPEAEYTAEKIADMIKRGVKVTEPNGSVHPCKPSDFCILVRKNYYTKAYVEALEKRGISARGSDEKGYLQSQEIAVLIDLFRIIENPLLDVPMAAVMVSPMYGFSITDLAYLKALDTEKCFYQIMTAALNGEYESFDEELKSRIAYFLGTIDKFRLDSITMTIGELISSIYDRTDFLSVMQLSADGEKKRANLRILIQYAQNYESFASSDGSGGLGGFLRHIDRISESGDYSQGRVSASSGEYVTVQTLHKSKGLEYPFVFICETSSSFKFDSHQVMCSDDGRIGFVLYNKENMRRYKTFQKTMLTEESMADTRSEEMRLLYVGLTRARQQLFINMKCGEKSLERVHKLVEDCVIDNSSISGLTSSAKSFSDWLWLTLMMHSRFPEIAEMIGLDCSDCGFPAYDIDGELFGIEHSTMENIGRTTVDELTETAEPDENVVGELLGIINSDYDRTLSNTAAKLSVTQIAKKFTETEEFDFHLRRPSFMSEHGRLTGAERGTAIHTFFQYCDFEAAIADTNAEISRLTEHGFLTKSQAECIDIAKIKAFFESDIYRRMCSAKSYTRERKFTVAAGELMLDDPVFDRLRASDGMIKGIVDLMFEEDDGIVIVDYKSDRGVTEDQLRERYTRQLAIYRSAIELTTGKKVNGLSLYSIEMEKEIVLA